MAGGNIQPGTSAPEQMPPTYGQQMPPMYQQPYVQPSAPMDIAGMMRKTFLIVIIAIGALFLFIGRLLGIYASNVDGFRIAFIMATLGGFTIAVPSMMWALGSKRTTDMQNLGLLLLAALVFVAMASWPFTI